MKQLFIYAILLFTVLLACNESLFAQQLTEAQKRTLERRVRDKVDDFQFYMAQLGDKESTSITVKNNAYRLALKLFIGEGEDYSIVQRNSLGEEYEELKPAVRMQTSSKYRSTKSRTKMKVYLNNLRNNRTYSQIEITAADAVRVDNIYREGDLYVCMAYFCQKYIGYRDSRPVYSDITTKRVKVYIQAIEIPKSDGTTETIWNALLGDIYVLETRPI